MILMSPYCYLAPYAGVEAAYMESFLENSSPKGKSDDDVAVPKWKLIAHHHMPSDMVYVYMYHLI